MKRNEIKNITLPKIENKMGWPNLSIAWKKIIGFVNGKDIIIFVILPLQLEQILTSSHNQMPKMIDQCLV